MYTFIRDQACRIALMLQVCCSVWQRLALFCSFWQCDVHVYPQSGRVAGYYCCVFVAVCCSVVYTSIHDQAVSQSFTVAGVLQRVATFCSVMYRLIHDQAVSQGIVVAGM